MSQRPDMSEWTEEVATFKVTIAVKVPEAGAEQNLKDMDTLAEKAFKEWKSIVMSFDRGLGRLRVEVEKTSGGTK